MSLYEKLEEATKKLSKIRRQGLPEDEEDFRFALILDDIDQPIFFTSHPEQSHRLALIWMPNPLAPSDAIAIAEIDLREVLCRRLKIFNIWALLDELIALEPIGGEQDA